MIKKSHVLFASAVGVAICGAGQAMPISPGDLVVYRVGTNGGAALSSAASSVFVDEFTPTGTLVQSIALPDGGGTSAANHQFNLVASGSATSEGGLTVSPDGAFISVTGYNAAVGTAAIASSSCTTNARVVGIITANSGLLDTSTALTDAFSGNNFRSAIFDGENIYVSGAAASGASNTSTGGVRLATLGASTSTAITNGGTTINTSGGTAATSTNFVDLAIYGGKLYASSTKAPNFGINLIGAAPTSTATNITNTGIDYSTSANPAAFVLATIPGGTSLDEAYVADGNKILKYSLVAGSYVATGSISGVSNIEGLTGTVINGNEVLYATNGTNIYTFTDTTGYNGTVTGTATSIATAPTGEAYRGIGLVPEPASLGIIVCSAAALSTRRRRSM